MLQEMVDALSSLQALEIAEQLELVITGLLLDATSGSVTVAANGWSDGINHL
jgi:hypothetical protein